ncbi:MAG: hypothetical protein U0931_32475 [Vulcanimicrobiota bacterium]
MDSQDPSIEEKLVPFVEGALAEADRREVLQALPNQPALNQEVRQLREAIVALRGQAARGLRYHSPVEAPSEQVIDFALNGEQWSRQSSRQFQLHLLESASLAEELEILRELEQDLQQRVEASKTVPEMPAALRQAIQETYGKPPADPAWKRAAAAIVAWTAGLNLKVASAAVAGCVLVVGGLSLARFNHGRMQAEHDSLAASTPAPTALASSTPAAAAAVAAAPQAAPAGQVALLKEKVLPEDLPGLSRRLYYKGVTHSYQDGQIYVAQADFDKAWSALQMNNEKASSVKGLKTGGVPQPKVESTNLLDGVIGQLPKHDNQPAKAPQPRPQVADTTAKAQTGGLIGGVPEPQGAVAVALPAQPEASGGDGYSAPAPGAAAYQPPAPAERNDRSASERPVVPRQQAETRKSQPVPRREVVRPVSRPAAPPAQAAAQPSQMARYGPSSGGKDQSAQSYNAEPPRPTTGLGRVFQSRPRKEGAPRPADTLPTYKNDTGATAQAPPIEALQKPANPEPVVDLKAKTAPLPAAVPPPPPAPVAAVSNAKVDPASEEENVPAPSQVALEQKKAEKLADKQEDDEVRPAGVSLRNRSDDGSGRNLSKQSVLENSGASRAPMSAAGGRAGMVRDESFQVQAGAPFEVAMLPVAKKLVEDLVGESKVQMERKEDGHLLVTIRPARSLSPQEVDKLRKVVREKLELKEEDTVVIRQP